MGYTKGVTEGWLTERNRMTESEGRDKMNIIYVDTLHAYHAKESTDRSTEDVFSKVRGLVEKV